MAWGVRQANSPAGWGTAARFDVMRYRPAGAAAAAQTAHTSQQRAIDIIRHPGNTRAIGCACSPAFKRFMTATARSGGAGQLARHTSRSCQVIFGLQEVCLSTGVCNKGRSRYLASQDILRAPAGQGGRWRRSQTAHYSTSPAHQGGQLAHPALHSRYWLVVKTSMSPGSRFASVLNTSTRHATRNCEERRCRPGITVHRSCGGAGGGATRRARGATGLQATCWLGGQLGGSGPHRRAHPGGGRLPPPAGRAPKFTRPTLLARSCRARGRPGCARAPRRRRPAGRRGR